MDVLDSYKIDLKNMRTDVAEYQFALMMHSLKLWKGL